MPDFQLSLKVGNGIGVVSPDRSNYSNQKAPPEVFLRHRTQDIRLKTFLPVSFQRAPTPRIHRIKECSE